MKAVRVKRPKWADDGNTQINCEVEWCRYPGKLMPFTASSSDNTSHGQALWAKLISGEYGSIEDYE